MRTTPLLLALTASLTCSLARAHDGPRIWVDVLSNRLITLASDDDVDPSRYYPQRVFTSEFEFFFGIHTTEFPGYEVPRNGGFGSAQLQDRTLSFSLPGELLYYSPAAATLLPISTVFPESPETPTPQLAVSMGSDFRISSPSPQAGFDFFTFTGLGDHSHLAYTLLGNGTSAGDGPDGVYALPFQLHSPGLEPSLPYYILFGKNVPLDSPTYLAARDSAYRLTQGPFIPEPSSLALILLPALALRRTARRPAHR